MTVFEFELLALTTDRLTQGQLLQHVISPRTHRAAVAHTSPQGNGASQALLECDMPDTMNLEKSRLLTAKVRLYKHRHMHRRAIARSQSPRAIARSQSPRADLPRGRAIESMSCRLPAALLTILPRCSFTSFQKGDT